MIELITKQYLDPIVTALVGPDLVDEWWNSNNKALGQTPLDALQHDPRRVYDYLIGHYIR